jgi:5-methylcytosine-specific restriction endonuclease McrA
LSSEQLVTETRRGNDLRNARRKDWTDEQREHANAQVRRWKAENRERHRQQARDWYRENTDRALAAKAADYRADPSKFVARSMKRKALLRDAVCEHGADCVTAEFLAEIYASRCSYCPAPAAEADHHVPLAKGGLHCRENIVPACLPCNRSKYAHDPDEWLASRLAM